MILSLLASPVFAKIAIYVAAGAVAALAFLGVRRMGVQKQQLQDAQKTAQDVERANEERSKTDHMSDADVSDDLRKHWTRD